jgi:hypothetical protein
MRSIHDIVIYINCGLSGILQEGQLNGIASTVTKDGNTLPAEGEKYVGIDDTYKSQLYHKITGLTITRQARGFGDNVDQLYTYAMSMIIFLNRSPISPEDFIPIMQANLPQQFKTDYTKRVSINFLSAVLNDKQVYTEEYGSTPYRLSLNQRLFKVNYSLEVLYKTGCFNICPEEINCKK